MFPSRLRQKTYRLQRGKNPTNECSVCDSEVSVTLGLPRAVAPDRVLSIGQI